MTAGIVEYDPDHVPTWATVGGTLWDRVADHHVAGRVLTERQRRAIRANQGSRLSHSVKVRAAGGPGDLLAAGIEFYGFGILTPDGYSYR